MKKCIIIANGKPPKKKTVDYFVKKGFSTIICADGGANAAKKLNIIPDFIIGDFDSILPQVVKYYKGRSIFINYKRQNDTDVEKCLKFAIKKKYDEVVLLGVTGDRLDHTICNLGIVIKFYNRIKIILAAENSILIPANMPISLRSIVGETISIYAFNDKTEITSYGLKYKLINSVLPFGKKESTSNVAITEKVKLDVRNGIIFIIRDFNTIKKYDLF